jgi:quercetin dioxygenase-like cupin family protein
MSDRRTAHVVTVGELPGNHLASRFDGHEHRAEVSFFLSRNPPGTGPSLHTHPYEETFILQEGEALFTVGDQTIHAFAGDILVVPAETPHSFVCSGTTALRQISIHPVARMQTDWLD